jgi:hypothetical protein
MDQESIKTDLQANAEIISVLHRERDEIASINLPEAIKNCDAKQLSVIEKRKREIDLEIWSEEARRTRLEIVGKELERKRFQAELIPLRRLIADARDQWQIKKDAETEAYFYHSELLTKEYLIEQGIRGTVEDVNDLNRELEGHVAQYLTMSGGK